MQKKTIKKNIENKLNNWLETITDAKLRDDLRGNILVSGGSIASMLLNEEVNDYDVYLMDMDVCKRVAEYYSKDISGVRILDGRDKESLINRLNSEHLISDDGLEQIERNTKYSVSLRNLKEDQIKLYFEASGGGMRIEPVETDKAPNYEVVYLSPNAISLSNDLQIVLRFWGDAERIHKTFDFVHVTNYFTFADGLVTNLEAVESILSKQLKYQGSEYPLTSIIRVRKFIKRGYNIGAGELLKIMFQISALDLTNPDVLEEQLIGVDVAYFDTLIQILRNEYEKDGKFNLTKEYLSTLIDKVFQE